jgi:hypothetical protein
MSDESSNEALEAKRQSILEARRRSVQGSGAHPALKPQQEAPKAEAPARAAKKKTSGTVLFLGVLLLLGALGAGAWFGLAAYRANTPEGRVRAKLYAAEFSLPAQHEGKLAEVDGADPNAVTLVKAMLVETEKVDDGANHSNRTVRELASDYLLNVAKRRGPPAPQPALDVGTMLATGKSPSPEAWNAAVNAWRNWTPK